jgi:hypothetical protein
MMKSRRMRWVGHLARMGAKKNACRILVGKSERKRLLRRPRRRWVDNIKMDVREVGWGGIDWTDVAQEGSREISNECSGSIKCSEILEWLNDWRLFKDSAA